MSWQEVSHMYRWRLTCTLTATIGVCTVPRLLLFLEGNRMTMITMIQVTDFRRDKDVSHALV